MNKELITELKKLWEDNTNQFIRYFVAESESKVVLKKYEGSGVPTTL